MRGQLGHWTRPHTRLPSSFLGMDAGMTSQLKVASICKLHGSLICLAYFLTSSLGVCTIRHWQTSGRLVQELNVCTVLCNTQSNVTLHVGEVRTGKEYFEGQSISKYKSSWILFYLQLKSTFDIYKYKKKCKIYLKIKHIAEQMY